MNLTNYLVILWRRKWVIFITNIIAVMVIWIGILIIQPTYSATATIRVVTHVVGSSNYNDLMYADRLMNTYVMIATSRPVMDELMSELALSALPKITAVHLPNTELIQITAEDYDPALARNIANKLANILVSQSRDLTGDQARVGETIPSDLISIVGPAALPLHPSKPNLALNIILGILAGIMGGVGLAFLFENLDPSVHNEKEIEAAARLPTLSKIPIARRKDKFLSFFGNPPPSDEFRCLRTNILSQNHTTPLKTILITSPSPCDGKSTVTANLAMAMAQTGLKVIVVDGDMRLPKIHKYFDLENEIGLSNHLRRQVSFEEVIQKTLISGIDVISGGQTTSKPSELLCSEEMRSLLDHLYQQYDIVLIDSPAVLAAPDAAAAAPLMDGVVLVVRRNATRRDVIEEVCSQMNMVDAKMLGVVINQAGVRRAYADYYYRRSK